jgi:exosome complex RNA-binding protein Rrp42 (RNase PH superfamily)
LFWKRGVRSDGRLFAEARPISIQHGILQTSEGGGSALVTLGSRRPTTTNNDLNDDTSSRTMVMAAVTVQVGQPSALAPNQGDVVVTVTNAGPSSSNNSRPGSSGTTVVQSFVQRILEENLDLVQLCLQEGQLAYRLRVTVSILQDQNGGGSGGSAMDACLAAAVAALLDTQLPNAVMNPLDNESRSQNDTQQRQRRRLHMPIVPCSLTAASVGQLNLPDSKSKSSHDDQENGGTMDSVSHPLPLQNHWLVDPHPDELLAAAVGVVATVVVDAKAAAAAADAAEMEDNVILAWHHGPHHQQQHHHHSWNGIGGNNPPASVGTTPSQLAQLVLLATSHARDMLPALSPPPPPPLPTHDGLP